MRPTQRVPAAAAMAVALALPALAQQPLPLADLLAAPSPSALVAAPDAERVAWVANERGARNVWVAEGPDSRGRALTA